MMTVQELINTLQKIENKECKVLKLCFGTDIEEAYGVDIFEKDMKVIIK